MIKDLSVQQTAIGHSLLRVVVDTPPTEFSNILYEIQNGKEYELIIRPRRKKKTIDQNSAIWAKIGEIAYHLYATKEEVYEEILRRYSQGLPMIVPKTALNDLLGSFKVVDEKEYIDDDKVFVIAYKGLSQMTSAEASRLLDGCLSELKEMGIDAEVK